jgi:hypothetical protein
MNPEINLIQLYEKNIKIEEEFNRRLKDFDMKIEDKEQQLSKLRELFVKEKKQYYANRLFNKGTLERNKELNQTLKNLKLKIKNVYQKLDRNNDRLNNVVDLINKNKQTGGGQEVELMKYLDKIELELKENIGRINFVEKELKDYLSGKDVELEKISQTLDQLIPKQQQEEENKDYDQEAETILQNINNIEKNVRL